MSDTINVLVHGHEFEISPPFTNRELHLIKQIAGVRAGELFDAMESGDNDLIVALAHIGITRAGRHQPTLDMLWDMNPGEIVIGDGEQEEGVRRGPSYVDPDWRGRGWQPGDDPVKGWRLEYASLFNIGPRDMPYLYPHQVLEMDEHITDLRRKQRG